MKNKNKSHIYCIMDEKGCINQPFFIAESKYYDSSAVALLTFMGLRLIDHDSLWVKEVGVIDLNSGVIEPVEQKVLWSPEAARMYLDLNGKETE